MSHKLIAVAAAVCVLLVLAALPLASGDCNPPPTGGDDNITCTGNTSTDVDGESGNDTITNEGSFDSGADMYGGEGNDTLINDGDFGNDSRMYGESGNDTLINNGTMGDSGRVEGGSGDDTLINHGTIGDSGGLDGDDGNDTVINHGTLDDYMRGGGGNDTLTNYGTVGSRMDGDSGDDSLTNYGTVGRMDGDSGNDSFVNYGSAEGITGDEGDDTVRILDRSQVLELIDGGSGEETIGDALHLEFKQREATPEEYLWFVKAMDSAAAANGYVCWMGDCYTWQNFERLSWRLNYNFGPAVIYFMDIPAAELPLYGDGTAPFCTFYSGQHGPKWIASEQCGDFTDASALDVACLDSLARWSSNHVSSVAADADGKLSFSTSQHGICGVFPSSQP